MIGFKYGSFNLQRPAEGIWVTSTDVYSSAENNIQADTLAEADGSIIVKQQKRAKTFTVEGVIRKSTVAALDLELDAFKLAMDAKNQAFDIDYAGGIRRYLANAQTNIIARRVTSAGFVLTFFNSDGIGWSIESTALLAPTGVTASQVAIPITIGGTYKAEPYVKVTVNTVTGPTNKTITISNGATLRGISVTRTWANGDRLEIDSLNRTVYVNDIAQDFNGQFPAWGVGAGSIVYLDDFTARDVTITGSYTKRWL